MEDRIVFRDIPVNLTEEDLTPRGSNRPMMSPALCEEYLPYVNESARPKAIVKWCGCEVLDAETVRIEDTVFHGRLLADKLKDAHRVFLFVATAGNEIKECEDIDIDALADIFSGIVLRKATAAVNTFLSEHFDIDSTGSLQPGSLPDWPIENNHALCKIIGNVEEIGVTLNEKGYMLPWNSVSGILFSDAGSFRNCSLCKNYDCIGRRVPFDPSEYKRIFGVEP